MKHPWLMNQNRGGAVNPAVPLDPKTRDELRALMAKAIEAVHLRQSNGETGDERRAISHKDHRVTPQPQSDRLSEAIVAEASRSEPGKPATTVCDGRSRESVGFQTGRND